MKVQRRGTAIVETPEGILVNATEHGPFILPGGRARKGESRMEAAIRELREETGLLAFVAVELFECSGKYHRRYDYRDQHKVYYVRAHGTAEPGHEVTHLGYYKPGGASAPGRRITDETLEIIENYFSFRKNNMALFEAIENHFSPIFPAHPPS